MSERASKLPASAKTVRRAIQLAVQLGQVSTEVAEIALEEAGRADPGSVTPALLGFWLDVDEDLAISLMDVGAALPVRRATVNDLRTRLFGAAGKPCPIDGETLRQVAATIPNPQAAPAAKAKPADGRDGSLSVGSQVGGFEIVSLLGEGGMGTVYRARQLALRRDVALKVVKAPKLGGKEAAQRFLREARTVAGLNHANVVTCFALGRHRDTLYLAMELVEGGDLEAHCRRFGGRLSEEEALALLLDAARGLCAIQGAGLVHRDIKPRNVFVTEDGRAKLGDLGLTRSRLGDDRLTETGIVVGTPAYMSPEQAEGMIEVDIRADIYALGATLFRALTGKIPFEGSALAIMRQKFDEPAPDVRDAAPHVSERTAAVVRRALEAEPNDRFPDAEAFALALERALRELRGDVPREASTEPPALLVVGLALAGLLLVGLLLTWSLRSDPAETGAQTARFARGQAEDPAPTASASGPVAFARIPLTPAEPAEVEPATTTTANPEVEPGPTEVEVETEPEGPLVDTYPEVSPPEPEASAGSSLWEPVRLVAGGDAFGRWESAGENGVDGAAYVVDPAAADRRGAWSRVAMTDAEPRTTPIRARFRMEATVIADERVAANASPALADQGFTTPAGYYFEVGLRTSNHHVESGPDLDGFALWLCLQADRAGNVHGYLRLVTDAHPAGGSLAVGAPGVYSLDAFTLRGAFTAAVLADLELTERGYRVVIRDSDERELHRSESAWADRQVSAARSLRGPLYLWAQLGDWANGRGRGRLTAFVGR